MRVLDFLKKKPIGSSAIPYENKKENALFAVMHSIDQINGISASLFGGNEKEAFVSKYFGSGRIQDLMTFKFVLIDILRQQDQLFNLILEKPIQNAFMQHPKVKIKLDGIDIDKETLKAFETDLFQTNLNSEYSVYSAFVNACILSRVYGGAFVFLDNQADNLKNENILDVKIASLRNITNNNKGVWDLQIFNKGYKVDTKNVVLTQNRKERVKYLRTSFPQIHSIPAISEVDYFWQAYQDYVYFQYLRTEALDENKRSFITLDVEAIFKAGRGDYDKMWEDVKEGLDVIARGNAKTITALPPFLKFDYKQINFDFLSTSYDQLKENLATAVEVPQRILFQDSTTSAMTSHDPDQDNYDRTIQNYRNENINFLEKICKKLLFPRYDIPETASIEFIFSKEQQLSPELELQKFNQISQLLLDLNGRGAISNEQVLREINAQGFLKEPLQLNVNVNPIQEMPFENENK